MYLPNNTSLQGNRYKIVRHISSGGFGNLLKHVVNSLIIAFTIMMLDLRI